MILTARKSLIGAVGLLASITAAGAADIDPIFIESAPELVPVEIGSGWYLRGDVSYDFGSDFDGSQHFSDETGFFDDGYGDLAIDDGFDAGLGIGHQFTDFLRGDLTAHYWEHDVEGRNGLSFLCGFEAGCGSSDSADLRGYELMANAYVDLGTVAGFTPYVGGGVGAVHLSYDNVSGAGSCAAGVPCGAPDFGVVSYEGEDSWRFAYSLAAGVAYQFTDNLSLDLGYRYLDVEGGDMYSYNGADLGLPGFDLRGSDDGFDRHTVQAGLRYRIW